MRVKYTSQSLVNIQFFIEFLFEIIREKDEPIVAVLELIKAVLKLKEYHTLITQENAVSVYLEPDSYRDMCLQSEIKQNHNRFTRSRKYVPQLNQFKSDHTF